MVGNELSRLFVVIGAKTSGFNKGMDKVSAKMQNVSRKMKIAGGIMVAAVAAVGISSLKMAADFDKAMSEVNTMMGLTTEEFKDFSKEVQTLAADMGVDAVEAAHALYQAISAGVPKENAIEFLRVASEAAIGGVTDTKTAVDGLTTVINAFKIPIEDAENVADIFFTTVKGGKTTFAELSASMFNVAPIAAVAGVKFEEVAAALAAITLQGTPTAVATTQLRQAILAVTAPTIRQRKMIEELGLSMNATSLQTKGLAGTFNELIEATGGNMEMLRKLLGSAEAVQAVLSLTGKNAATFAEKLDDMAESAGAAHDAFLTMEETPARKLAHLQARLRDIGITIGASLTPALLKMINTITPIIKKIGDWISKHTNLTIAILAGVAAIGALLLIGGMLLPLLSTAIASLHLVAAAQWAWNIAMSANPIGLLVVGIGLLVAAIVGISRHWKDTTATVKEQLAEQTRLVQEAVDKQREAILGTTNAKIDALKKERDKARKAREDTRLEDQKAAAQGEILTDKDIKKLEEAGATEVEIAEAVAKGQESAQQKLIDWMYDAYDLKLSRQIDAEREHGDSLVEALEAQANAWQLVIDKATEYLEVVGTVRMTEWQLYPPAPPQFMWEQNFSPKTGKPLYGNVVEPKALGGLITSPTLALLGEKGPEMVVPLSGESPQTGITNTFNISGLVVREEADIKRIARELYHLQQTRARAMGVA